MQKLNQNKLTEILLKKYSDKILTTDYSIVANTYSSMSKDNLDKILRCVCNRVNENIYNKKYKRIEPKNRIVFFKFHELDKNETNRHAHIIVQYPKHLDKYKFFKQMLFNLMTEEFEKLDRRNEYVKTYNSFENKNQRRFTLYIKKVKTNKFRNVHYATKQYNQEENLEIS